VAEPWFDELSELIAIPSVSADSARAGDVKLAAEWLAGFIRGAGGSAEVRETSTHPLILGDLPASNGSAPTVLVYGHVDVQPPDPLELWESEPFALEERDGWLYGRGVVDDKGQLYMLARAAADLATAGDLRSTSASPATPRRKPAATRSSTSSPPTSAGRTRR
jgi:acetylornithine deacetylase/succinyl-diaminopimelate desuccinylase-like protein